MKMELPKMIQLTKQQTLIPRRIWLHAAQFPFSASWQLFSTPFFSPLYGEHLLFPMSYCTYSYRRTIRGR